MIPTSQRRPFVIDEQGFLINGRRDLDIQIDPALSVEQRAAATEATNDRFERVLVESERCFGPMTEDRYPHLVKAFMVRIVLPVCRREPA